MVKTLYTHVSRSSLREEAIQSVETLIAAQPATSVGSKSNRKGGKPPMTGNYSGGYVAKDGHFVKPRAQRKTDEERQYKIHYNEDGRVGCYQCL